MDVYAAKFLYYTQPDCKESRAVFMLTPLYLAFTVILHEMSFRLTPLDFEGAVND